MEILRYLARTRLANVSGIYVESSTALPGPMDYLLLLAARLRRVPVLTYVRDAYQLFPEYYPISSPKRWLARRAFGPAITVLTRLSSVVAFPTQGLAIAVSGHADAPLLPPGSRPPTASLVNADARTLLYVGDLRSPAQGGDLLLKGVTLARDRGLAVELLCVVRPGQEPVGGLPAWVRVARAEGDQIDALLDEVIATVIPRPRNRYNDLALPTKLFEYLAFGRPLIVTDATEQARIVRESRCGVVVPGTAEGIADGIARVASADPGILVEWDRAAREAAEANSWESRARRVLELLEAAA